MKDLKRIAFYGISLLVVLTVLGCQREGGFLEKLPKAKLPVQQIPPPVDPTPTPGPAPLKHKNTYVMKVANTAEFIPKVDVLWVIDNSGSMAPHQQAVINNTQRFMQNFTTNTRLQWKMGLISTSQSQQPFLGFAPGDELDQNTAGPIPKFQAAVARLTTGGEDTEKTYTPVLNVLRNYPNFLTDPKAYLALVVVTDEEEQSTEPPLNLPMSAQKFVTELAKFKGGDKSKIVTFGVFQTQEQCGQGFMYATSRYRQLILATNGKTYSLCDPNFGQVLSNLGNDLIQTLVTLHPVIPLEKRPIASTIKVLYKGAPLKYGFIEDGGVWIYDPIDNVIKITDLTAIDPKDKNLSIEYDLDPEYHPPL